MLFSSRVRACCEAIGGRWNANIKILLVCGLLFATITSAQFVAAFVSNSNALLVDCYSMLVDTMSYGINLVAECRPRARKKERNQLIAAGLSLGILLVPTVSVSFQSLALVQQPVATKGWYCVPGRAPALRNSSAVNVDVCGNCGCGGGDLGAPMNSMCSASFGKGNAAGSSCQKVTAPDRHPVSPWIVFAFAVRYIVLRS